MKRTSKSILILGSVFLSAALLLCSPALAKDKGKAKSPAAKAGARRSGRGSPVAARPHGPSGDRGRSGGHNRGGGRSGSHDWGRGGHGRHGGSRFGIGFGFGTRFYSGSYQRWVPGWFETRIEQVLVEPAHYEWQRKRVQVEPGRYEVREVPPVEETRRDADGKAFTVIVEPARTETVWIPPRYEERKVNVWVADRYEQQETRVWIPGRWVTESSYRPGRSGSWLSLGGIFRF